MKVEIYNTGPKVSQRLIDTFESTLGPLPAPYRRFILETNGGSVVPPAFKYYAQDNPDEPLGVDVVELLFQFTAKTNVDRGIGVNELLKLSSSHGYGIQAYFTYVEHLPRGLIAVGICTKWRRKLKMGYILISIRPEDYGRVYLWQEVKNKRGSLSWNNPFDRIFLPKDLWLVAEDFDDFLAKLHWPVESEPWAKAVEYGDVRALEGWINAGENVDRQCPALRLNALEFACMGNIFTPRSDTVETACTEMAALLASRSSAPEVGLEWAGKNWLRIAAVIPYVTRLGTLRRVQKELRQEAGIMPLFTGALTEAGKVWAAQLPQLQDRLSERIRELSRKA